MKTLQVKEHAPPNGMEYQSSSYPGQGVYVTPAGLLAFVSGGIVYPVPGFAHMLIDAPNSQLLETNVSNGVSESFVLKALAIAQNPQLAIELAR
jgi:hypothetical protein